MAFCWWDRILDLLFPPKCPLCGKLAAKNGILCPECEGELPRATSAAHLLCDNHTLDCAAPFFYDGRLRAAFLRYKFQGKKEYANLFGSYLAQAAAEQLDGNWELVTWAPLSKKRLRKRGYDQAKLLAEQVSKALQIPLVSTLEKMRDTKAQSTLGAEQRGENVKNVYRLEKGCSVTGKRILLVDDILTTGSTLSACAKVLLEGGAERVDCAALARSRDEEIPR
jgi:ComF family protein